jgi:hypothetical protein
MNTTTQTEASRLHSEMMSLQAEQKRCSRAGAKWAALQARYDALRAERNRVLAR